MWGLFVSVNSVGKNIWNCKTLLLLFWAESLQHHIISRNFFGELEGSIRSVMTKHIIPIYCQYSLACDLFVFFSRSMWHIYWLKNHTYHHNVLRFWLLTMHRCQRSKRQWRRRVLQMSPFAQLWKAKLFCVILTASF